MAWCSCRSLSRRPPSKRKSATLFICLSRASLRSLSFSLDSSLLLILISRCFPLDGTSWVCYVAPSSRGRTMRPVGVTIIAVLTWIRGTFYVVIGLVLLVVGHLSARLV